MSIFFFVIEYTTGSEIKKEHILLFLSPIIIIFIYIHLTPNELYQTISVNRYYTTWSFTVLGYMYVGYLVFLHIISIGILLIESLFNDNIVRKKQSFVLLLGYVSATIPAFIVATESVPSYLNPAVFSLSFGLAVFAFGMKRYDLFSADPLSNEQIKNSIREGIIAVNDSDLIIDVNDEIEDIINIDIKIGDNIERVYDKYPQVKEAVFSSQNLDDRFVTIDSNQYNIENYNIGDDKMVIVFQDNTDLYDEKEKLDLLRKIHARILRHNLRNELNIVKGHTDIIINNCNDKGTIFESTAKIQESVDRVLDINSKTVKMNRVIETNEEQNEQNLKNIIDRSINELKNKYDKQFNIGIEVDNINVLAHPMLEDAVMNAIENAIVHNDGFVEITIKTYQPTSEKVSLIIEDDGVGIKESETKPIKDHEITQLDHCSSSGLWLMKWIVEYGSNGDLDITATPTGTRVAINLQLSKENQNS